MGDVSEHLSPLSSQCTHIENEMGNEWCVIIFESWSETLCVCVLEGEANHLNPLCGLICVCVCVDGRGKTVAVWSLAVR